MTACDFADGGDLAHIVCVLQLLHGHVSRKLDHLEGLSAGIENRVIGSLNPDLLAAFADALVFGRLVFAAIQGRPELAIFAALLVGRLDKHAVVLALNLLEPVTQRLEEVVVGIENCTVHVERDDRLRFANRRNLPGIVGKQLLVDGAALSAMTIPGCGSFISVRSNTATPADELRPGRSPRLKLDCLSMVLAPLRS